jgi:hypothetical protein
MVLRYLCIQRVQNFGSEVEFFWVRRLSTIPISKVQQMASYGDIETKMVTGEGCAFVGKRYHLVY